ncbi:MAG TPA: aldehyde dehydrogenase family protein [Microthrixaceae bacterium]|nr:aldehyde dehydrogenase family protein [Microthrixaceae bacterium]
MTELGAPKTYKLYSGGAFIRSESGRVYPVAGVDGGTVRVAQASRKDLRDAVVKARAAQSGWGAATPYLRGQILYRIAEMLDGRRDQFVAELENGGVDTYDAAVEVDDAVDTWVYWAGWTDKLTQVLGGVNPVAGPFLNVSTPEPTGVVGVIAPTERPLSGLSALLAPVLCGGNTAVVLASEASPFAPLTFGEVLATSDVPAGVANLLVGPVAELAPWLADHHDVDALDISGVVDTELAIDLTVRSADNLKRVARTDGVRSPRTAGEFLEIKTVWHPARL